MTDVKGKKLSLKAFIQQFPNVFKWSQIFMLSPIRGNTYNFRELFSLEITYVRKY